MTHAAAFDALAADYDAHFSESYLGRLMRDAVWRRLDSVFFHGMEILELNCGTGEDALHLARRGVRVLATDQSTEMLGIAARKIERADVADRVHLLDLRLEDLGRVHGPIERLTLDGFKVPFDGAFSNFGGLNCVPDVVAVVRGLAALLRPGAPVVLCIMGPFVPWEWAWSLYRRDARSAFRRLRRGGVQWRGLTVRYPSVSFMRKVVQPAFRVRGVSALGTLMPPTYLRDWAARHRRFVRLLYRVERWIEDWPLVASLADHFVLEIERR